MDSNEKKYYVYMHTSPSGKVYIGITRNKPEKRWGKGGNGYKTQQYFWRAICKYGWNNFDHKILYSYLTKEEAEQIEINLIDYYKSDQRDYGYNVEHGGNSTGKISDETRKKISESNKGRESPNKGKPMSNKQKKKISDAKIGKSTGSRSEETKKKIGEANKNKTLSDNTRQKISEARKENWKDDNYRKNQIEKHKWQTGENHPWFGKHHSEETKEKIRQASIGRVLTEETKIKLSITNGGENNPFYGKKHSEDTRKKISESNAGSKNGRARMVAQYDNYGNFIRIWGNIREAATELNINYSSIVACCRDRQQTAGGFMWKYYIEEDFKYAESIGF